MEKEKTTIVGLIEDGLVFLFCGGYIFASIALAVWVVKWSFADGEDWFEIILGILGGYATLSWFMIPILIFIIVELLSKNKSFKLRREMRDRGDKIVMMNIFISWMVVLVFLFVGGAIKALIN